MHRVRVRNRASVGATVARRAYSPAPICACVSTRRLFGAEIVLGNRIIRRRTSCNGDFGYRRVSPHPGLLSSRCARFFLWSADFLQCGGVVNNGQRFLSFRLY
ncbi:hypothetical protein EVAR_61517_1 [Eumeta japonica]|uniref:Uncharacterized protein n=1 Tax=Eumeta variegata TaxID=151549 RepID=A0A4C2A6G8_EUMVA|nr:hypothetical protein EVAR_61517_1 [Eumeta japonica]